MLHALEKKKVQSLFEITIQKVQHYCTFSTLFNTPLFDQNPWIAQVQTETTKWNMYCGAWSAATTFPLRLSSVAEISIWCIYDHVTERESHGDRLSSPGSYKSFYFCCWCWEGNHFSVSARKVTNKMPTVVPGGLHKVPLFQFWELPQPQSFIVKELSHVKTETHVLTLFYCHM